MSDINRTEATALSIQANLIIDTKMLKQFYDEHGYEYSLSDAIKNEFGWLNESGIFLEDWKIIGKVR